MKNSLANSFKPSRLITLRLVPMIFAAMTVLAPLTSSAKVSSPQQLTAPLFRPQAGIPDGYESYAERPDILDVPTQALPPDSSWEKLKAAHFSLVAQLLAIYPSDTHLYFLARDAEYLYDVARLVTEGTPDFERIHLLNVSRRNMKDPHLKEYLGDNGISEDALRAGRKVLFVDTGFQATIPKAIGEKFPEELRIQLKTHLIVSSTHLHPSTRSFLVHLNPSVIESSPDEMRGAIVSYEYMPRFTETSSQFAFVDGRWQPLSLKSGKFGISVSRDESVAHMSDLRAEWNKYEVKTRFMEEIRQLQALKELLQEPKDTALVKLSAQIETARASENALKSHQLLAHLIDLLDAQKNIALKTAIKPADLGIEVKENLLPASASKKNEWIAKHPELAPIFESPSVQIQRLFEEENWRLLGYLVEANIDFQTNKILARVLFSEPVNGLGKELQIRFLGKANSFILSELARHTFSKPHAQDMYDLLRTMIEKTNKTFILSELAEYTFSKPHTKGMGDLLKLIIQKSDDFTLLKIAQYVFSQAHTRDMTEALKLVIEKGDSHTLETLAKSIFTEPFPKETPDLVRLMIEKGGSKVLQTLARTAFAEPSIRDRTDLLRQIIEKGDAKTLNFLSLYVFGSKPAHISAEWKVLRDSLKIESSADRKAFIAKKMKALEDKKTGFCARFLSLFTKGAAAPGEIKVRADQAQ